MKRQPPENKPSTGILTLLDEDDEPNATESAESKCKQISETIYQCLSDKTCRHKFSYETVSLCAWPHPDHPDRTPHTLPCCDTTEADKPGE